MPIDYKPADNGFLSKITNESEALKTVDFAAWTFIGTAMLQALLIGFILPVLLVIPAITIKRRHVLTLDKPMPNPAFCQKSRCDVLTSPQPVRCYSPPLNANRCTIGFVRRPARERAFVRLTQNDQKTSTTIKRRHVLTLDKPMPNFAFCQKSRRDVLTSP
jgi:hypothetical protein